MMKVVAALVGIALGVFVLWRFVLPALFVSLARGPINTDTVVVKRVSVSDQITDSERGHVSAGTGHKFLSLDCSISVSPTEVDIHDFQFVKDRASSLGTEENVGNNMDLDYFFWTFLDSNGTPIDDIGNDATEFGLRLIFKVPVEASRGYLFYWGEYFGPVEFGDGNGS
ncbi:MAG TPA: hypothetical protein VJP78_14490 [Thermoleophilia bacterium]|nr:hypothetical protein [Thermoleophilia bacterium]